VAGRVKLLAILGTVAALCGLCGLASYGLIRAFIEPPPRYVHAYPAPAPGCGDTSETEAGPDADNWDNDDYAVVACHPDHVDIDSGSGTDPTGVHDPSWRVFGVESNIDGPRPSEIRDHDRSGFLMTVTMGVHDGGDDARGGITIRPYPGLRDAYTERPVYYFSVDRTGRWHVDTHDIFGRFAAVVDAGRTPWSGDGSSPVDHVLKVRLDAHTYDLTFTVDGFEVKTVRVADFEAYRVGIGVACSYQEANLRTCWASFRDYQFEELT
jgi:hypothetical protein